MRAIRSVTGKPRGSVLPGVEMSAWVTIHSRGILCSRQVADQPDHRLDLEGGVRIYAVVQVDDLDADRKVVEVAAAQVFAGAGVVGHFAFLDHLPDVAIPGDDIVGRHATGRVAKPGQRPAETTGGGMQHHAVDSSSSRPLALVFGGCRPPDGLRIIGFHAGDLLSALWLLRKEGAL